MRPGFISPRSINQSDAADPAAAARSDRLFACATESLSRFTLAAQAAAGFFKSRFSPHPTLTLSLRGHVFGDPGAPAVRQGGRMAPSGMYQFPHAPKRRCQESARGFFESHEFRNLCTACSTLRPVAPFWGFKGADARQVFSGLGRMWEEPASLASIG